MFGFIKKWFKRNPKLKSPKEVSQIDTTPQEKPGTKLTKELKATLQAKTEEIINQPKEEIKPNKNPIINGSPKMGRPRKEFDTEQFEKLCKLQCTEVEICSWFQMCSDTLTDKCKEVYGKSFSDISHIYRETGKSSLRRTQWMLAEKSAYMAVFLGKNYLHQKDDPLIDQSVHYHYTQVNDTELIKRARERGIAIPQEIERGLISEKV